MEACPKEILELIFSFLGVKDCVSILSVSKRLKSVIEKYDSKWKKCCLECWDGLTKRYHFEKFEDKLEFAQIESGKPWVWFSKCFVDMLEMGDAVVWSYNTFDNNSTRVLEVSDPRQWTIYRDNVSHGWSVRFREDVFYNGCYCSRLYITIGFHHKDSLHGYGKKYDYGYNEICGNYKVKEGLFLRGSLESGSIIYPCGTKYYGSFVCDELLHGFGIIVYWDGVTFEGMWEKGKPGFSLILLIFI